MMLFGRLITAIEDLSNQIILDIFDYFNMCDLYEAFSSLNKRFQCLINSSSLSVKISLMDRFSSAPVDYYRDVIIPNRHRIISLHFWNSIHLEVFFTHCVIDESFSRLESLTLSDVSSCKLMLILFYLKSLPRLFALTIRLEDDELYINRGELYRMIFCLPALTYCEFFAGETRTLDVWIPFAINERFSAITTLIIDHSCTLNEFTSILCRIPQLSRLECRSTITTNDNVNNEVPIKLTSLKYFAVSQCIMTFDEWKTFLKKISSQLRALYINRFEGESCVDCRQWEQLISQNIPHLRKFSVECLVNVDKNFKAHHFNSRLMMERCWSPQLRLRHNQIFYSITSNKY